MTENRRIDPPSETDAPTETPRATGTRSLGEQLQEARQDSGMELSEIARLTHVRRDYLVALEHGHYSDLPEPVYTRNFVRLFAQTIGLPVSDALAAYDRERDRPAASSPVAVVRGKTETRAAGVTGAGTTGAAGAAPREARRVPPPSSGPALGGLIPTLLLVFVVVGLAVWGFNSTLFRPGSVSSPNDASPQPASPAPAGQLPPAALPEAAETVRLSISSEPAGARVYVDEFPLDGVTPISSAPVTGRDSRMVRLELEGYEPSEASIDLSFDRNLSFVLIPAETEAVEVAADGATEAGETPSAQPATAGGEGQISLTVSDLSWLEVYQGTQRSGTPLVYTTATAGQSYRFSLPVYVHVGNAAGVQAMIDGEDIGSLGSAGQVLGRAFTQ